MNRAVWLGGLLIATAVLGGWGWRDLWFALQLLDTAEPAHIKAFLLAGGALAPLLSLGLMLLQALVAPLPAFAVSLANGWLWGGWWGGCLSLLGGVLAAWVCYELARGLGREWVQQKLGPGNLQRMESWIQRWGFWLVVGLRLLPFLPFDPLSYALGLSPLSRRRFVTANLLGQIPGAFVYAAWGAALA